MIKTNTIAGLPAAAISPEIEAGARDQKRFIALYDTHAPGVYRFCLRLAGGRAADAEDLTQEVMVAAYQGLPRFAGRSAVRTWLYRIAVFRWRSLRDAHKRTNGGGETTSLEMAAMPAARTPDMATVTVVRLSLETALSALPDPLREAFLLVKAEGLTHREAALVLQLPQGTVQSRVHEAVKRLRVLLADDFPTHSAPSQLNQRRPEPSGASQTPPDANGNP